MALDPIELTEELLQKLVDKFGPELLDELAPHYPDADFSEIKRPDRSIYDARAAALKGSSR